MKIICTKKEFAHLAANCESAKCDYCSLEYNCHNLDELQEMCEIEEDEDE